MVLRKHHLLKAKRFELHHEVEELAIVLHPWPMESGVLGSTQSLMMPNFMVSLPVMPCPHDSFPRQAAGYGPAGGIPSRCQDRPKTFAPGNPWGTTVPHPVRPVQPPPGPAEPLPECSGRLASRLCMHQKRHDLGVFRPLTPLCYTTAAQRGATVSCLA